MKIKRIFFCLLVTVFLLSCGIGGERKMTREDSIHELMRDFEDTLNKVIKDLEKVQ